MEKRRAAVGACFRRALAASMLLVGMQAPLARGRLFASTLDVNHSRTFIMSLSYCSAWFARLLAVAAMFATVPSAVAQDPKQPEKTLAAVKARVEPRTKRMTLIFTHAAGFRHGSIPTGANAIRFLGRETGAFDSLVSDDPQMFEPERLKEFDAVILVNTTGDWLLPKLEKDQQLTSDQKQEREAALQRRRTALLDFVRSGKGVAGFHAASDSHYNWKEFGELIGGYFDGHPWHQKIGVQLTEPKHTLLAAFGGQGFEVTDEIYQFKAPYSRERLRVLLTMDNASVDASKGKRSDGDYAIAWLQEYGKGRVFYSSLGHRDEIYGNPPIMQFYLDGIQYALGDLPADGKPSAQVGQ